MAQAQPSTPGSVLAQQLMQAIEIVQHALLPDARDLPVLSGINPRGIFTEPQENVLANALNLLAQSGRVYVYGNSVVMEVRLDAEGPLLSPLRTGTQVEQAARKLLSNLMVCGAGKVQFAPPESFIGLMLLAEPLLDKLPRLRTYARRPVFDNNFVLRDPGWHGDVGVLVHGPVVDPIQFQPPPSGLPAIQRLPHHLQTLLSGFCFRSDADLVNAVAMFLTGLLVNHFVTDGKPIVLVDGNQPELGKTLLVRVMGLVLDGIEPALMRYILDEEELQKTICAKLKDSCASVLLIDNAKAPASTGLSSPTIESQSLAPEVSFRILGKSTTYRRPNDFIWAITMNGTKACSDIVTRGIPVQLYYEGDPRNREFQGFDPIEYASEHRLEILGELAGLVGHWNQQGRPLSDRAHRCRDWAAIVGGILESAGLDEFLSNLQTASATFNTALDELAALAEAVVAGNGPFVVINAETEPDAEYDETADVANAIDANPAADPAATAPDPTATDADPAAAAPDPAATDTDPAADPSPDPTANDNDPADLTGE